MINQLIFDFDGTLADTREILEEVFYRIAEKHRLPLLSEEEVEHMRGLPIRERFREWGVPITRLPVLFRDFRRFFDQIEKVPPPYPGVIEMIRALQAQRLELSLISSNSRPLILKFLQHYQIDSFQPVISTSGMFGKHRYIGRLLKEKKRSGEEALYVGDELRDVQACKKVSVKVAAVTWGYDKVELLEQGHPDFLIHHPLDLPELVAMINGDGKNTNF